MIKCFAAIILLIASNGSFAEAPAQPLNIDKEIRAFIEQAQKQESMNANRELNPIQSKESILLDGTYRILVFEDKARGNVCYFTMTGQNISCVKASPISKSK
jgi:hypothetical protein